MHCGIQKIVAMDESWAAYVDRVINTNVFRDVSDVKNDALE